MAELLETSYKRNDRSMIEALSKYKRKCKCGHVLTIIQVPYKICDWCGHKVYRSDKDKFLDKIKESRFKGKEEK